MLGVLMKAFNILHVVVFYSTFSFAVGKHSKPKYGLEGVLFRREFELKSGKPYITQLYILIAIKCSQFARIGR